MAGENIPNNTEQGGAITNIGNGGLLNIKSGGVLDKKDGSITKHKGVAQAEDVAFSIAAGGSNVSEVTITRKDLAGNTIAGVFKAIVSLSDAASGAGLTGTTASGTVTAKAASGRVVTTPTAKKEIIVESLATGVFILEITDTAKTGFYVNVDVGGKSFVSRQLVTADYGA